MTERSRYFLSGSLALFIGVLLFIALFYGIREFTFVSGDDADENFLAFAVGLGTFLVCSIIGSFLFTIGITKPRHDA